MPPLFSQSENLLRHKVRAKYIPQSDGSVRLAMVQKFDRPVFMPAGWECCDKDDTKKYHSTTNSDTDPAANIERATRRAKIAAFDLILCNPDLDTFLTLTYNPESVDDRASYADTYKVLKTWLSNRVQRHGLKYVLVPERHKAGGIHFHAIVNSAGLDGMIPARSPHTGRLIKHHGRQIYNLPSWSRNGFSTAEMIEGGDGDRDAVAKYIFKYMTKQGGTKVGGRYFLHGGDLLHPIYGYADDERDFFDAGSEKYSKTVALEGTNYSEWSFI